MTKFRELISSNNKRILAGKNAENNEELIKQIEKENFVLHTKEPGSPFVEIKGKADKKDIHEAAVFCAAYSKDWKKNKENVKVHIFKAKDIFKQKDMKTGTFGVKKVEEVTIKKEDILKFLENKNG